jgi:hypothetical protein
MIVATSMPMITTVPRIRRPAAPEPDATHNGTHPGWVHHCGDGDQYAADLFTRCAKGRHGKAPGPGCKPEACQPYQREFG